MEHWMAFCIYKEWTSPPEIKGVLFKNSWASWLNKKFIVNDQTLPENNVIKRAGLQSTFRSQVQVLT